MQRESGKHLGHTNCNKCGSSDALDVRESNDSPRWINGWCWSCETFTPKLTEEQLNSVGVFDYVSNPPKNWKKELKKENPLVKIFGLEEDIDESEELEMTDKYYIDLPTMREVSEMGTVAMKERSISAKTCKLFGDKTWLVPIKDTDKHTRKGIFYPIYKDNTLVGYKPKTNFPKDHPLVLKGKAKANHMKCFEGVVGDKSNGCQLYGQNLHKTAPRRVVIFGGQEDAKAGYEMYVAKHKAGLPLGQVINNIAFVSIQNGENAKDIKENLKWFETAQEIRLCFDNDPTGDACTLKVAKVLGNPRKVSVMTFSEKDASDLLVKGKANEFWDAFWGAKPYCPAGIYDWASSTEAMLERGAWDLIPFPESFGNLNTMTLGGYGLGEIITLVAPTSVGKSSFVNEMLYTAVKETDKRIGVISLEADRVEFNEQMTSLELNYRLVEIPEEERDRDEIIKASSVFNDRIFVIEDMVSVSSAEMFWEQINFLVNGLDCEIIVFDPATTGVVAARMDEREFLADLVAYVKRNRVAWANICHTRKTGNGAKAGSEGADISEEDLMGSGDWIRNSMITAILTRNKLAEDEKAKNTTRIKVPKIRRNGSATGIAGYTFYNKNTGRLELGEEPRDPDDEVGFEDDVPLATWGNNDAA